MRQYLFAGQDILVPDTPQARPCLEERLPEAIAASAIGCRDFDQGGERCCAYMLDEAGAEAALALGLRRIALRRSLSEYDEADLKGALHGIALLRALEISRFCGACGSPLSDKAAAALEAGDDDPGGRICL